MSVGATLLYGAGFGLFLAAPVGPMSLLCVNRTLKQGFWPGLATGIGIALADGLYALSAVSGFSIVNDITESYATPLRLLGSLFLGYLGVKALWVRDVQEQQDNGRSGIVFSLGSAFLLTLANPATLLTFLALAASLGTAAGGVLLLPASILLGSVSWWLLLTLSLSWIGHRLPTAFIRIFNLVSALIFIIFSMYGICIALLPAVEVWVR